jgi:6,7-dimethyl-8-ribityllumazine synthase
MAEGPHIPTIRADASRCRVAIVVSRYNAWITDRLLEGAVEEYARLGGDRSSLVILPAPGAFELPALTGAAVKSGEIDAVVALGCLIRGETRHDRVIADAVAGALAQISAGGTPVGFGLLTVETAEQAEERAGGAYGNKGAEAMQAAILTFHAAQSLKHAGLRS